MLLLFVFIFIILIILLWKYYYIFTIMYNSKSLSIFTPEDFLINREKEKELEMKIEKGMNVAKKSKVVFCGLLRDSEKNISTLFRKIKLMGKYFYDYKVVIVENDSSDQTRNLLLEKTKNDDRYVILGCGINVEKCNLPYPKTEGHSVNYRRIEKMCKLRNIYLDYVKSNLQDFNYVFVWDMDIYGSIYIDGIFHSLSYFDKNFDIDCICAYGIYHWGLFTLYYDTYAHIDLNQDFHIKDKLWWDIIHGLKIRYKRGDPLLKVKSCFSGFSIYRLSSLMKTDATYEMSKDDRLECEHTGLCKYLKNVYMNPSMINLVAKND